MTQQPFARLSHDPHEHYKLYFYGAVLSVLEQAYAASAASGGVEAAFDAFPFLVGYNNELASFGLEGQTSSEAIDWWRVQVAGWEAQAAAPLPLNRLMQAAGLEYADLLLLFAAGLPEEDPRFGLLFQALHGLEGQPRPTYGLFNALWAGSAGEARFALQRLVTTGLLRLVNPQDARLDWAYEPPAVLWEALRGGPSAGRAVAQVPGMRYVPPEDLLPLADLVLPTRLLPVIERLPALLEAEEIQGVLVRGPRYNGRRTLLGALARAAGRGILVLEDLKPAGDERWDLAGPLATLLHALPAAAFELPPGESVVLPELPAYRGPLGLALSRTGGVKGPGAERLIALTLDLPDEAERLRHWSLALRGAGPVEAGELERIAGRYRLTSGRIRGAARLARSYARLDGRGSLTVTDVQQAGQALNRQELETLAQPLPVSGSWDSLAAAESTCAELRDLQRRCRSREQLMGALSDALNGGLNAGVRALFTGPSGTGKTLAARLLAAELSLDLYRVDLSAVVNKYIGETEKNLNQVFARAEELDVILLLDEGDALLTQRTHVQNANDRYANLETNFLLQRIETYEGILIITTNAGERIDQAFHRRMDVVVEFHPPEPAERWAIWQMHLPENHAVDLRFLQEVSGRCALTGGQIRNAALHAGLLALHNGGVVNNSHLEGAIQREYRKTGAVCPLRR